MRRYALRRILLLFPVLLGVSLIASLSVRLLPGDIALVMLGPEATPDSVARLRASLGLNEPWYWQYLHWLGGIPSGNWGRSLRTDFEVSELVARNLSATAELAIAALSLGIAIGIPLGILATLRRDSWFDGVLSIFLTASISMPAFAVGTLLILLFAIKLHWLPSSGYVPWTENPTKNLARLVMPALALSLNTIGDLGRITRAAMLDTDASAYVRYAQAKGLPVWLILWRHRFRNAVSAVVSVAALEAGYLLGGAVLIETLFGWPGIGLLLSSAIFERDYPVIQMLIVLNCAIFLVLNLSAELIAAAIDPRVRYP